MLERIALKDGIPDNCIFIPLQFYPEATTDYWIKESNMINFHNDVIEIIKEHQEILRNFNQGTFRIFRKKR